MGTKSCCAKETGRVCTEVFEEKVKRELIKGNSIAEDNQKMNEILESSPIKKHQKSTSLPSEGMTRNLRGSKCYISDSTEEDMNFNSALKHHSVSGPSSSKLFADHVYLKKGGKYENRYLVVSLTEIALYNSALNVAGRKLLVFKIKDIEDVCKIEEEDCKIEIFLEDSICFSFTVLGEKKAEQLFSLLHSLTSKK